MPNLSFNEKYRIITDLLTHILLEPKFAFIAPIGVGSKLVIDSQATPYAATDGISLYIGVKFWEVPVKYRLGILVHEMLHVFLGHTFRRGDRDPFIWNEAGDFIVNDNVIRTFHEVMPEWILYDKKYEDWATEQVYEAIEFDERLKNKLMDDFANARREMGKEKMPGQEQGQPGGGQPGQGRPGQVPGQPGAGRPQGQPVPGAGGGKEPTEADIKGGFNGSDVFETPKEDVPEVESRIREGFTKGYGSLPGGLRQYVKQWLFPELPWQQLLSRFMDQVIKENYRFGPFRRAGMYRKVYLPTQYEEAIRVAVAIDTSGSVGDETVGKFLNEVRAITELNGAAGFMIPTAEHIEHVFEFPPFPSDQDIERYIKTGGTDFRPPFEYIMTQLGDDINAMIYLTDGEGPYPAEAPPYPVLWVLSVRHEPGSEWYPPFGEVIYLPSSEKY